MLSCDNLKGHFKTNPRLIYIQRPEAWKVNYKKFLKLNNVLANLIVAFNLSDQMLAA